MGSGSPFLFGDPVAMYEPKFVESEVGSEQKKFYPVSMKAFFQMRAFATPIAKAISTLLGSNENDQAVKQHEKIRGEDVDKTFETQAILADLARLRSDEKERALEQVCSALMDEKTGWVVVALIQDSMREDFKTTDNPEKAAKEYIKNPSFTVECCLEMLKGVAQANKKLVGPLGMSQVLGRLTGVESLATE